MGMIPKQVLLEFGLQQPSAADRFGTGLIHDTYKVINVGKAYLVQKLNHHVFKNIEGLMNNIEIIIHHIEQNHPLQPHITLLKSKSGKSFVLESDQYWRCMQFIEESRSFEKLQSLQQAFEAGKIIGEFHKQVAGIDTSHLIETIPDFHNFNNRLKLFKTAVIADSSSRARHCATEIEFLLNVGQEIADTEQRLDLPTRVTHNDTKLNNILFDSRGKGLCLVDLDTLMPGKVTYDTGDVLRTMCNPSGEDGNDGEIELNKSVFTEFAKGYIVNTKNELSKAEILAMPFSIKRMAGEQAIRFLTDYLQGDIYYKQPYEGFNLKSVRAQIELINIAEINMKWLEKTLIGILDLS